MKNSFDEPIKRLLFTGEPFDDESFIGYIMRLAEMNEIPDLRWILKLAGMVELYDYRYKYNSDFKVDTSPLSILTGASESKLNNLLYLHEQGRRRHIVGNLIVFGQPIRHYFIVRDKPKICPACLAEENYCRKVWELTAVTCCPVHQCLLIQNCPKCNRSIDWKRPKINLCHCEYDFRNIKISKLESKELRLSRYIHRQFGLPCAFESKIFKYPLSELELNDVLTVLFFAAAHFAEMPNYTGASLSKTKSCRDLHQVLCRGIEVFDHWAKSYYDFISMWKKQDVRYFINCKNLYLSKTELPREYSEYELFNQMLHNTLYEQQFSFMHEGFQEYLLRLPSGDFSSQPALFD